MSVEVKWGRLIEIVMLPQNIIDKFPCFIVTRGAEDDPKQFLSMGRASICRSLALTGQETSSVRPAPSIKHHIPLHTLVKTAE